MTPVIVESGAAQAVQSCTTLPPTTRGTKCAENRLKPAWERLFSTLLLAAPFPIDRMDFERGPCGQVIAGTLGSSSIAASIRDWESSTSSSLPAKYAS